MRIDFFCLVGLVTFATVGPSMAAPITDLFNTGVDVNRIPLAVGASDPNYKINNLNRQGVVPVFTWNANTASNLSRWISPISGSGEDGINPGNYEYETTFYLPKQLQYYAPSATITGQWATDNAGIGIFLNGTQIASYATPPNSFNWHSFTIPPNSNFIYGTNKLVFKVNNESGYSGLKVELGGSILPYYETNKDFVNSTGQVVNGMEWLIKGSYTAGDIATHIDGRISSTTWNLSKFEVIPAGPNTLLRWTGLNGETVPIGGSAHFGVLLGGANEVTFLGVSWRKDGVLAGCANQVSIAAHDPNSSQIKFENYAVDCETSPLYVGGLSIEWFDAPLPLSSLTANANRTPIRVDTVAIPPTLIQSGASVVIATSLHPPGAKFAMVRYAVSKSASFSGSDLTVDFIGFALSAAVSTIAVSASPPSPNGSVVLTATVSGNSATGTVQFKDNGQNIGVPVPIVNGVASLTVVVAIGHVITAEYSGDSINAGSVSATGAVVGSASADIPTLPEWAALLLALMLPMVALRHRRA